MVEGTLTDSNFDEISWHDNFVYSIILPDSDYNFKLDIDYIQEWIENGDEPYNFIVAPSILCFQNVFDLSINLKFERYNDLCIESITRENKRLSPNGKVFIWDYYIAFERGDIKFSATGFYQQYTAATKLMNGQKYD